MKNVLFLDDDPIIGETVYEFLGQLGHHVKVAHDGDEGIQLLKNGQQFNVVITDMKMPTMSGNEVARYIRDTYTPSDIHVVGISGSPDGVEKHLFDTLLQKPFKLQELAGLIGSLG